MAYVEPTEVSRLAIEWGGGHPSGAARLSQLRRLFQV